MRLRKHLIMILSVVFLQIPLAYAEDTTFSDTIDITDIITIAIPVVGGAITSKIVVTSWQKRVEETKIRRQILEDFQVSIKDYIILMDVFLAKIVLSYRSFNDKGDSVQLSNLLPFGFADREDDKDDIRIAKAFLNFDNIPSKKLEKEIESFRNEFFEKRQKVTRFLSGLRLYYSKSNNLNTKMDLIWLRIMVNHMLILKILESQSEKEFVELVTEFNKSARILFISMSEFDIFLGTQEITFRKIGKKD